MNDIMKQKGVTGLKLITRQSRRKNGPILNNGALEHSRMP